MENGINNMIIVTDSYGRQKTILANHLPKTPKFFDDGHFEQLDGLLTYEFSTLASDPDTQHLIAGNNVIVRNKDRKLMLFTIIRTVEERKDNKYVRRVFAENAAVDDLYNHVVDGEELVAVSVKDAATKILAGSGWQLGIVDYAGLQNVNLREYPTALAALHQIRDQYGLEMEFTVSFMGMKVRDRFVHLVKRRGNVTGKRFTYGKDLTGVTREVDRSDIATAVIPIGKADETGKRLTIEAFENIHDGYVSPKGQKWVGDEHAMQLYGKNGKHLFKRLDLSSVDNEYELMKKAVEELKRVKQPRATYEASVLLLESLTGYEHEKVRLGDTILVKDTMFEPALAVNARVIAIYRSYTNPTKDYVLLGEFVPLVIDKNRQIEAIQETINQNMTKWEQGGEFVYKSATEPLPSKRTPDMLWLDTSKQPNVMKRWDAEKKLWVNASVTTPEEIGAETPKGAQDKANKAEETAIAEAAEDAAIKAKKAEEKAIEVAEEMDEEIKIEMKSYVEGLTEEVEAEVKKHADQKAKDAELNAKLFAEGYAEKEWHYGETPPEDLTQIWFDMSSTPNKIRKYNEKTKKWEAASPTSPKDIGAETPAETLKKAQDEAKKAQDAAIKQAEEMDKALKTESERLAQQAQKDANAHTDSVTKLVEEALKKDSQDKANAAKEGALSEADRRILEAKKEVERNAAADAKLKADAAQKAATDRANAVKNEVENFAKDAGNITQGTLAAQRLHGVTISGKNAKIVDIDAGNITAGTLDAARLKAGSIKAELLEFGGRARDVAENRPVTYSGGNGFSVNGGMTSRYNGAGSSRADKFPCTMSLDFGTVIGECVRIQWTSYYSNDARYAARSYKLETSLDGTNWTTWADVTNNTNPIVSHGVVGNGQVRYVRLTVRAPQEGQTSVNVANFEVHSVQAGTIVTGDAIITGRIDATKVNVDNLNANNITSGTMTADRINGGTINAANTNIINLNAGNITSGTIDASKITVTNMNAANITSGILNADHIGSKSISTYKLTVGDFTNYCVNPKFESGSNAEWDGINVQAHNAAGVPAGSPTGHVGRMTGRRDATCGDLYTAEQDELFYVEFQSAHISGSNQFAIGMICYDKDKKPIGYPAVRRNAGGWSRTTGEFMTPANTKFVKVWAQINAFENHGDWVFTDVVIRKMTDSKLLVNGSVHTSKIAANAVTAEKVAANAITADKIAANAVNANNIAAGSITTDKIAAAGITADKITSGILDANKVQVRNLSAAVITSGTMSADRITGGTINANNTNIINLKAQNIASGTINADNVTISNGRVTIGKDGVQVTQADFLVKDAKTGFTHSLQSQTNLIVDHSFEMLSADGDIWNQCYRFINWEFITENDRYGRWARVGSPRMIDGYNTDVPEGSSAFGRKAVLVNSSAYVYQDIDAKANTKYTISFHASKPFYIGAGAPQVQVEYVKNGSVIGSEVKNFAIPSTPAGEFVRYGFTVTTPSTLNHERTNRIRLRFRVNGGEHALIDGVQAVQGDKAVPYDSEDSLWVMSNGHLSPVRMHLRNLMMQGNTRVEGGGLSIAGRNANGVGLEMSERLRIWGNNPIEVRQSHVEAMGYRCIDSRPAGVDRMIWVGWHDQAGNAIYVYIGGSWKVAVRL
ncbi:hypothetical protein AT278_14125 [Bacillus cereus]|nr:hypothetical protein AT278_14125 [Bacillus cereus]